MNAHNGTMGSNGATPGQRTQRQLAPGWNAWPATLKELTLSYYNTGFPAADAGYALAGLARYAELWQEQHGHRGIPQCILDEAAAAEVRYHHYRGREFRRPCAALSACWTAIICDRPERIFQRWERLLASQARQAKRQQPKEKEPRAIIV